MRALSELATSSALAFCRSKWEVDPAGELVVGGTSVTEAAEIAGGTPLYVYDRRIVSEAIRDVRSILSGAELFYSIKANPFPPLLEFMAPLVDGFDVASSGELSRAVSAGKHGNDIQFSGPGKGIEEIRYAIDIEAILGVESIGQLHDIADGGDAVGKVPRVALRINPGALAGGGGLRMAAAATQFGIDLEDLPNVIAACRERDVDLAGFHFYWGSQCLEGTQVADAQRVCWRLAQQLADSHDVAVRYLNVGGGFGIPYYRNDSPFDLEPVGESIAEIREELISREPQARMVVELGRYLVGVAGIYVSRIVDIKRSGETTIAVTDGGMHHHLAASGGLGNALKGSFPCCAPTKMLKEPDYDVRIVGRLCTPIDVLCSRAAMPPLDRGDLIAIFQSGAYGASASPQGFLSHAPVRELLL